MANIDKTRKNDDNIIIRLGIEGKLTVFENYKKQSGTFIGEDDLTDYDESNYLINGIDIYWENIQPEHSKYNIITTGQFLEYVYNGRNFPKLSNDQIQNLKLVNNTDLNDNSVYGLNKLDDLISNLEVLLDEIKIFDNNKNTNSKNIL